MEITIFKPLNEAIEDFYKGLEDFRCNHTKDEYLIPIINRL